MSKGIPRKTAEVAAHGHGPAGQGIITVEENNLTQNISALRKALGGNGSDGQYIETIPRVGYRLGVPVHRKLVGIRRPEELSFRPGDTVRLGDEPVRYYELAAADAAARPAELDPRLQRFGPNSWSAPQLPQAPAGHGDDRHHVLVRAVLEGYANLAGTS